ncbi:helix-turn-helix domain-containing protein [Psychrobacillus sp. FSL K6-2365]|uniref:helix-turn-helix transcriptional regulator n=1 Tax=Psychrobacillus sp. FSL K6-2365 TaxID=2921546 RepID=UPI0030F9DC63
MISNSLKEARLKRGISISELARRTKLSRMTIANIENKRVVPNLESAIFISRELDEHLDDIFFEINVNHALQ